MAQLIFSNPESRFLIQKRITTVGTEATNDALVNSGVEGITFTLVREETHFDLMPGKAKIRVNGLSVSRRTRLNSCDRIEWDKGLGIFLNSDVAVLDPKNSSTTEQSKLSWNILQNLASTLQRPGSLQSALYQALDGLIEMAGAETGYLLSEIDDKSRWELLAFREEQQHTIHPTTREGRRQLFSNSILQQALQKREPIYIENIIGHPWADAESVIAARIFSAACLPLCVGERVVGAVFLSTQSPGRSIKRESLSELNLVATQAALVLALESDLKTVRKENTQLRTILQKLPNQDSGEMSNLVFNRLNDASKEMLELDAKIRKLAPTPLSIIIRGETGSGKEVVAREIHSRSPRATKAFVAVNCGAIPAALLESVLFGHEKGAFTGAVNAQTGKFLQAHGGTLLLDEIGDLPLDLQVKLLRILQERKVEPIGAKDPIDIDVRILAATHQDLETAVRAGKFRQDLYFRLMGATVKIPALRERKSDIAHLAQHFLAKTGSPLKISNGALDALEKHSWPGNVRELEQVITRASYISDGPEISVDDIDLGVDASNATENTMFWNSFSTIPNLKDAQLAFTREFVQRTIEYNGGNRLEAALRLGISERTLYRVLSDGVSS